MEPQIALCSAQQALVTRRLATPDRPLQHVFSGNRVLRQITGLLAVAMITGCTDWPPTQMYQPADLPGDRRQVHRWISRFLEVDVATARRILDERLDTNANQLKPLVHRMGEFIPCQVHHRSGVGYVRCIRRYYDTDSRTMAYESLYIAEPPPAEALQSVIAFFDEPIRPLARNFIERFAGSGEEMEGMAGHFTFSDWPLASEFNAGTEESFGGWLNAKLLYIALNGDSVFVRMNGSTAWHVLETDEIIPIAQSFAEFITIYADFRGSHETFDSWSYRDYFHDKTK